MAFLCWFWMYMLGFSHGTLLCMGLEMVGRVYDEYLDNKSTRITVGGSHCYYGGMMR